MRITGENPYGKKLQMKLEPLGGTPGAVMGWRTGRGSAAFVAYLRNIKQAPEQNLPACRRALELLAEQGHDKIWLSYFATSPVDGLFEKLGSEKVALFDNFSGKLDAFKDSAASCEFSLAETDYDDPRLAQAFADYARMRQDRFAAAAPELCFSIWRFDAFHDGQKPHLILDAAGRVAGALLFWCEPTHYDPRVALPVVLFDEKTKESGKLEELFRAAYRHIAASGSSNVLFWVDAENEPLKALVGRLGFSPVSGFAGQFLVRLYTPPPK